MGQQSPEPPQSGLSPHTAATGEMPPPHEVVHENPIHSSPAAEFQAHLSFVAWSPKLIKAFCY